MITICANQVNGPSAHFTQRQQHGIIVKHLNYHQVPCSTLINKSNFIQNYIGDVSANFCKVLADGETARELC